LRLAQDIARYGGKAVWLDAEPVSELPHLAIPRLAGPARSAVEAVPLQLLSVALAEQTGIEPGAFRHLQKVTVTE
jgi:glutamine---fructose-6-phosphate transaminase (isomerizing)